jgi:protein-S-isoprenylcysteine O-methyltransferase Ste14
MPHWIPPWPAALPDRLLLCASALIGLCVAAVLAAVAANFAMARASGAVSERRRSPVATATMLGFAYAFYVMIHRRIGVAPVPPSAALVALTLAGCLLVVAGSAVNIAGRLNLGRNWADQVTLYDSQSLVTTGVYGIVRHPLYASLIWIFVGTAMAYHNPAALAAALLIFTPAMAVRARQEEALLGQAFLEYAAYQKRVGMLWPRLPRRA